ncbi:MAG: MoxR family ATPase [Polyangiaceae bacterium]
MSTDKAPTSRRTPPAELQRISDTLKKIRASLARVIRGKPEAIELLLVGLFSGGHVLIEDVPGVGKTTLAKALARSVALDFGRVQFTPDLLPSDIIGTHTLNPREGSLTFQRGPVFTNVLLADEINRASPRTQSALLEAMSESQVTVDGKTMRLPEPFFVLATQNPVDFQGTYPLPEAQLDRFVLRLAIGYPDEDEELEMMFDRRDGDPLHDVEAVASREELAAIMAAVRAVHVEANVARYIRAVIHATRKHDDVALGVSPRGALVLFRACQARALLAGRTFTKPDDVQSLARPVLAHRVLLTERSRYGGKGSASVLDDVVRDTPVPL